VGIKIYRRICDYNAHLRFTTKEFMPFDIIDHEKYTFKIDAENQFMEYSIKPDVTIDAPDVIEAKQFILQRYPNIKFYVLARGIEFFTLTREARALSAGKEFSENTLAVAFYTTNASLLLIGNMYLKIDKPHAPTRIFNNLDSAKDWLSEKMGKPIPKVPLAK
jgi:hypothetical protein